MTFLERLQAHKGGLICLKTQLYWYGDGGWDGNPGRLCVMLEAGAAAEVRPHGAASATEAATTATVPATGAARTASTTRAVTIVHLLIDGRPQWVWAAEGDVEIIDEAR